MLHKAKLKSEARERAQRIKVQVLDRSLKTVNERSEQEGIAVGSTYQARPDMKSIQRYPLFPYNNIQKCGYALIFLLSPRLKIIYDKCNLRSRCTWLVYNTFQTIHEINSITSNLIKCFIRPIVRIGTLLRTYFKDLRSQTREKTILIP